MLDRALQENTPESAHNGKRRPGPITAVVRAATVAAVAIAAASMATVTSSPAYAEGDCSNGMCQVYLSQAETQALAENPGWSAPMPSGLDPAMQQPYQILIRAHGAMARRFERLGLCSELDLAAHPLVDRGYKAIHCH